MTNKKAIITGAGIAGLAAGCYLQMNGYETEIFEAHTIPGGLCTAWKKNGYTFDGCIHTLGGLSPKYRMHQYWNELIDLEGMQFHFYDELSRVVAEDGTVVHFYTDPDKLEQELTAIAPEDTQFIRGFIQDIKHLAKFDTQIAKPIELWNPLDYYLSQFRTGPYLGCLSRWKNSLAESTRNCKSALLKRVLNPDFFAHFPAYFFLISLANMHNRNAGYPVGGSLPLALAIEKKYRELGGRVHYNAKVARINVAQNRAVGVTLENGETHNGADVVISAADGHATIFDLLGGKYRNAKIDKLYSSHPKWPSAVLVSLGLARTFEREAGQIELYLKEPLRVDDQTCLSSVPVTIYNYDPTLAKSGKTCLRSILLTRNFEYWRDLRANDPAGYEQAKERIAADLIAILDRHLGDFARHVEVIDVSTPATFQRYTHNWQGCIQGWEWLPGLIPETLPKELPGLKNFYMAGQWVMPGGGVSSAVLVGRDVTRIICKRDRKKFQVS